MVIRDTEGRALAATLQRRNPGWLIMWSPWRRGFSAFACWNPGRSIVIDARGPEELLHLMLTEEMTTGPVSSSSG
ncbi:hypothetical protein [Spongiactinospora gelatinilytica]|uniref:hypothetical protein n=1 Tax=Spongiactinospora gelatinilytica TaxID=2666298 RepID=UPI0011B93A32|nr:hypothetical protein [Spongiactinospora gelatinilytica]